MQCACSCVSSYHPLDSCNDYCSQGVELFRHHKNLHLRPARPLTVAPAILPPRPSRMPGSDPFVCHVCHSVMSRVLCQQNHTVCNLLRLGFFFSSLSIMPWRPIKLSPVTVVQSLLLQSNVPRCGQTTVCWITHTTPGLFPVWGYHK